MFEQDAAGAGGALVYGNDIVCPFENHFYKIGSIKSPINNDYSYGSQTKKKPNGGIVSPVGLLSLTLSPLKVTRLSEGNESFELTFRVMF